MQDKLPYTPFEEQLKTPEGRQTYFSEILNDKKIRVTYNPEYENQKIITAEVRRVFTTPERLFILLKTDIPTLVDIKPHNIIKTDGSKVIDIYDKRLVFNREKGMVVNLETHEIKIEVIDL